MTGTVVRMYVWRARVGRQEAWLEPSRGDDGARHAAAKGVLRRIRELQQAGGKQRRATKRC